jgi:hypothetical protein
MRGRDDVHADVRNRAGESEYEKRGAVAECDRCQAASGEQTAPDDEWPSTVPRRMAPIAPPADEQRHGEASRGVHHHHQTDQSRSLPDFREKEREVRRRDGPDETGADSRRSEDEQVSEAPPSTEGDGKNAGERRRDEGFARDGAPRTSRPCPGISCDEVPSERALGKREAVPGVSQAGPRLSSGWVSCRAAWWSASAPQTTVPPPQRRPRPPASGPPLTAPDFGQRALARVSPLSFARAFARFEWSMPLAEPSSRRNTPGGRGI